MTRSGCGRPGAIEKDEGGVMFGRAAAHRAAVRRTAAFQQSMNIQLAALFGQSEHYSCRSWNTGRATILDKNSKPTAQMFRMRQGIELPHFRCVGSWIAVAPNTGGAPGQEIPLRNQPRCLQALRFPSPLELCKIHVARQILLARKCQNIPLQTMIPIGTQCPVRSRRTKQFLRGQPIVDRHQNALGQGPGRIRPPMRGLRGDIHYETVGKNAG